jgi:signal recognition particle subunit SRP54
MLPSENRNMIKKLNFDNRQLVWTEAIIKSMTQKEREIPYIINGNRRQRIAKGSGRSVQEVNHLLKQFSLMQRIMKKKGQLNIPSLKGGMKKLSSLS